MKMAKLYEGRPNPTKPDKPKPIQSREYAMQLLNAGVSTKTPAITIPFSLEKCICSHESEVHAVNFDYDERKYLPLGCCLVTGTGRHCGCEKFEAKG